MYLVSYICILYRGHGHLQGHVLPRGLEVRVRVIISGHDNYFLAMIIQFTIFMKQIEMFSSSAGRTGTFVRKIIQKRIILSTDSLANG